MSRSACICAHVYESGARACKANSSFWRPLPHIPMHFDALLETLTIYISNQPGKRLRTTSTTCLTATEAKNLSPQSSSAAQYCAWTHVTVSSAQLRLTGMCRQVVEGS